MVYIIGFLLLLGLLVLAHELGHFLMGKWCKVKIEAFSIGFGKPILKKKIGETEYRLSMIPLGGYVKFLGGEYKDGEEAEIPADIKPFTFAEQKVWVRSLIVFAGPAFNFILAVLLFAGVYFIGEPNVAPVLGYVEQNSIAWEAGLRDGDRITNVDGKEIKVWNELNDILEKVSTSSVNLVVNRAGESINLVVPVTNILSRSRFGEAVHKNGIQGIAPYKRSSMIGVLNVSDAQKLGLNTGDLIVKIGETKIESWDELEKLASNNNSKIKFYVKRMDRANPKAKPVDLEFEVNSNSLNDLGIYPSELFVTGFMKDKSPAKDAGVLLNDMIVAVNGKKIYSFMTLQQMVDVVGRSGQELELTVFRDSKLLTFKIAPELNSVEGVVAKENRFLLGIETSFTTGPVVNEDIVIRNPFVLIYTAVEKTLMWIWFTILGLFKLISGAVSLKAIGGPLMIGKVAGDSLSLGIEYFLRIAAVISINLGIINLVPIPVLDGGHLMFFGVEAITRRPVKEKYINLAQQIGFYLLMGLVALSFYNDIVNLGSSILGIFK